MRKLLLWISLLGMLSCTRNPGLVLGVGLGIYAAGHRPVKDARRMFAEAHALHKAGKWWASTELLKETMKVSSDAMVLNIIGKNFQSMGQPKVAEHWYIRSTH